MSRATINRAGNTVVGVPLTTSDSLLEGPPYRITIPATEIVRDLAFVGEIKDSIAKTDQIRVLDKLRLEKKMGTLTKTAFIAVGLGLSYLLDLP